MIILVEGVFYLLKIPSNSNKTWRILQNENCFMLVGVVPSVVPKDEVCDNMSNYIYWYV